MNFTGYFEALKTEIKIGLQYKMNAFFYLSIVLIPPLAIFFLWKSILSGGVEIGGYNLSSMVTYYLIVHFFVTNTPFSAWREIGESIKDGTLTLWLIRPLNHYILYFFRLVGAWIINWIFGIFGIIIIFFILKNYVYFPTSIWRYFASVIFWLGGIFIGFTYGYILNLMSFWIGRSGSVLLFSETLAFFLSGSLIPLDLLPFKKLWLFLPFRYCGFIPAQIYLGGISLEETVCEFFIMFIWVFVLVFLSQVIWSLGIKKYQASGG